MQILHKRNKKGIKDMEKNAKEKLDLLLKDSWDYSDLMAYENRSSAVVYKFMNEAIKLGAGIRFSQTKKVSVEKYLGLKGIDRMNEINVLKLALKEEESEK